jgi:hypothetical protein
VTPLERLLAALKEHGASPQESGTQFSTRCPAHDDQSPSLSVGEGKDGRALVKCHRGCDTRRVLAEIGLDMRDLFPATASRRPEFQREHIYQDENAVALYKVCKRKPQGWSALRADLSSESGWSPGLGGVRRVPYRLPELLDGIGDPVWCCEGERDADTAVALGMVATAAASNGWQKAELAALRGRQCIVVCDRDSAGYRLGLSRAAALRDAGALVDAEDIVWPCSANDLTDLAALVEGDLYEVLEELRTIPETPPSKGTRSIEERASPYGIIPKELLAVSITARGVYFTLDLLAGSSGIAKHTIAAFAEREGIGTKKVAAAFSELEAAKLIGAVKRGTWSVNNRRRSKSSPCPES